MQDLHFSRIPTKRHNYTGFPFMLFCQKPGDHSPCLIGAEAAEGVAAGCGCPAGRGAAVMMLGRGLCGGGGGGLATGDLAACADVD